MILPLHSPLPLNEYKNYNVVVCCYEEQWVPLIKCPLQDAIKIYQKFINFGTEILIFPQNFSASNYQIISRLKSL